MVAEELEPLIAAGAVAHPLERGNMAQCAVEQSGIREAITDAFLERTRTAPPALVLWLAGVGRRRNGLHGGRSLQCSERFLVAAAAHRTSVNNRLQRTVQGQRQNSQA